MVISSNSFLLQSFHLLPFTLLPLPLLPPPSSSPRSGLHVRLSYRNSSSAPHPLTLPGCTLLCPLDTFKGTLYQPDLLPSSSLALTRRVRPTDWRRECGLPGLADPVIQRVSFLPFLYLFHTYSSYLLFIPTLHSYSPHILSTHTLHTYFPHIPGKNILKQNTQNTDPPFVHIRKNRFLCFPIFARKNSVNTKYIVFATII